MDKFGILRDLVAFVFENKKFWLLPILAVTLILAVIIILSSNAAIAPLIYTLF